MEEYISQGVLETEEIAASVAKRLRGGDVILFKGGLGAGKTAFTRGLANGLGLKAEVSSPTFSLVHEYAGEPLSLFHFDMYRVEGINDLYTTGFFDYLDENQIIAVEWSENIACALNDVQICGISVEITQLDENKRKITICGGERF